MKQDERAYQKLRLLGHKLFHYSSKSGQKRILITLHKNNGSMRQQALMEQLEIKAGSLSEILSKMEEDGLIVRKPIEPNRKGLLIETTALGDEKILYYIKIREDLISKLFKDFKEEELLILDDLLDRCLKNFDEECK